MTLDRCNRVLIAVSLALCLLPLVVQAQASARISDLTVPQGSVPRRLVGYGIVVGLDGTGDRSFGTRYGAIHTVSSVVNLLRRFNVEVPSEHLRLRNVAAVLVTAEVSPFLRAGGRFEIQVAAVGDAVSLRGGVLWMTPLVENPNAPPVATAQGPLIVTDDGLAFTAYARRGNSGRIPDGGVLEVNPPVETLVMEPRLLLRQPDMVTANRIASVINTSYGDGSATVEDPGAIALMPAGQFADNMNGFLAAVDTLPVQPYAQAVVVIDAREGTVVAGGGTQVGAAAVSHHGLSLQIGSPPVAGDPLSPGSVWVGEGATVQDVAAGLHAAGAAPEEIAAIFDALRVAGAINARVVVR